MAQKSNKRLVLFIATKSVWGGAQKYVHDIAVNLPKKNFRAAIAAGGSGPLAEKTIAKNVEYIEIKSLQRDINFLKEFFSFFEILFVLFKTKPNIVHVSSSKASGIAGLAILFYSATKRINSFFRRCSDKNDSEAKSSNCPPSAIFTVHGWAFLEKRPRWQIFVIKFLSKITCLFYDKIIFVSENDFQAGIENKIMPVKKTAVIHNGINRADYNFLPREKAREALGSIAYKLGANAISRFWIGTIGEFTKNKGHEYLIESMKFLQPDCGDIQTFIIGWGEEKENLRRRVKNEKLDDKIFIIDKNDLEDQISANYLKAFDMIVFPSVKEGLPYLLLEAGLAKLPVIASNAGGIPEVIDGDESGILTHPAAPQELANTIKEIIEDAELKEKLATNLNKKIAKEFSLDAMLEKTIGFYDA